MTDILTALKECAENRNIRLLPSECNQALTIIQNLSSRLELAEMNCNALSKHCEELLSDVPRKDSPTVNAIKWTGRWSIFVVALFWTVFLVMTWEWTKRYYADAGAVMTIFWHAAVMLREWWTK